MKKIFSKIPNREGFMLIELLVVLTIILILAAIFLVNLRSNEPQFLLQRVAHKLAQDARRTEEMAVSAKEYSGSVPSGGYGVNFNKTENNLYTIYADTNGNEKYDGSDGKIEIVYLEQGVKIQDVSPTNISVNFKPPSPTVKIKDAPATEYATATVILYLESNPAKTKKIEFNTAGLISVE